MSSVVAQLSMGFDLIFDNLEITTHTDLNTFWNLFDLDLENNT